MNADFLGGHDMSPYEEKFPKGSRVRVVDRAALEQFKKEWGYHNPLSEDQLTYAGKEAVIHSVGYYHGGDVLYWLQGVPGTWHEVCLTSAEQSKQEFRGGVG
jgi:hypothetical protein